MTRFLFALAAAVALSAAATAHMVYVVPAADGKEVAITVVFSDSLEADEKVDIAKIGGLKLTGRYGTGMENEIALTAEKHALKGKMKGIQPQVAYGSVDYGVVAKGDAKPALLRYHPKAVLAGTDEKSATIGKVAIEIVPIVEGGKVTFRVLASGKPVPDVEVSVTTPDGKKEKVKADKDGRTQAFEAKGRFAAYAKYAEATAGEAGGKKYEEIRHYATLVFDAGK